MPRAFTFITFLFYLGLCAAAHASSYNMMTDDQRKQMAICQIDRTEYDRLMGLSQKDFDQDFDGGWRSVAYRDRCANIAGEIIKAYMLYSEPHPPQSLRILRWHAGQMKANAGLYEEAQMLFRGTYNSHPEDGPSWNLYVDATLAFLDGDRDALVKARDELAQLKVSDALKESRRKFLADNPHVTMPAGFVDQPQNLSVVEDLLRCFGQPYDQAYGKCGGAE